jgi:hypothetical protein
LDIFPWFSSQMDCWFRKTVVAKGLPGLACGGFLKWRHPQFLSIYRWIFHEINNLLDLLGDTPIDGNPHPRSEDFCHLIWCEFQRWQRSLVSIAEFFPIPPNRMLIVWNPISGSY